MSDTGAPLHIEEGEYILDRHSSLEFSVDTEIVREAPVYPHAAEIRLAKEMKALIWLIENLDMIPYGMKHEDRGCSGTDRCVSVFKFSPFYNI